MCITKLNHNGARGRTRTGTGVLLPRDFKSLASTKFRHPGVNLRIYIGCGGWGRNRTGVDGFAGRCITTLPPSLIAATRTGKTSKKNLSFNRGQTLERETRFELATPTLARLCSTAELFPLTTACYFNTVSIVVKNHFWLFEN